MYITWHYSFKNVYEAATCDSIIRASEEEWAGVSDEEHAAVGPGGQDLKKLDGGGGGGG
jgi:hypothetical protein